jgi:hypothetical protein
MLDNNTLWYFRQGLEHGDAGHIYTSSLAQVIESLVLADRMVVDKMSFDISGMGSFLTSLDSDLLSVVGGVAISDDDRAVAVTFAREVSGAMGYRFKDEQDELQSLRAYFYSYISVKHGLPYFPNEKRTFFLSMLEGVRSASKPVFRAAFDVYAKLRQQAYAELRASGAIAYAFRELPFPPLFYYLLAQSNSIPELVHRALNLRDTKNARAFRKWCNDFTQAAANNDEIEANKMFRELAGYLDKICRYSQRKYAVQLQLSFPLGLGILAEVPLALGHKRHLLFLKQVLSTTNYPELEERVRRMLRG